MSSDNQTAMNPTGLPYQRCLIPNIPENAQHIVRDVTSFVIIPLDILLAFLSIISNSLVLTSVIPTRSLQHPSLLLLCSLSITDLLWATVSIVRGIRTFTLEGFCPGEMNELGLIFQVLCFMSTLGNLAIISYDRFLAVKKPWWYRNHMTRSRVVKQTSLIWILSLTMCGMVYSRRNFSLLFLPTQAAGVMLYATFLIVIVISYAGIFIANRRHRATIHQRGGQMSAMIRREKKLANTVGLILLVLLFTFMPALVAPLALSIMGFSRTELVPFRPFYRVFITLNGLLNPLLNYGRNKDVRRAVRRLIRCSRNVNGIQPPNTNSNERNQGRHTTTAQRIAVEIPLRNRVCPTQH